MKNSFVNISEVNRQCPILKRFPPLNTMQYHVTQSKLSRRTVVLHFYVDHLYFDTQMTEKYSTAMCQYQTDPGSSRVSALHFPSLNKKDDLRTHFNYKSCFMIFHDWFFWRTFVFLCINKITYSFLLPSAWTGKSHRLHHLCMAHVAWVTKPALCYLWILGLHAIAFFKKVKKKRWLQQFRN